MILFYLAAASVCELYWLSRIFSNSAMRSLKSLDFFDLIGASLLSISCLLLITEVKFICLWAKCFLSSQISTLLEPMRKYWPSLSCGSPRSCHHKKGPFWGHEVVSLLSLLIDCLNLIQLRNWHILLAFLYADSGDTQLQWGNDLALFFIYIKLIVQEMD